MKVRKLGHAIALLIGFPAIVILATSAYAADPTVPIVGCVRAGGSVSVQAGSPLTLVAGWTMSTRGNTQAFANAATGIMTVNGQAVTPMKSEVFPLPGDIHPDGNADDAWRVRWSFATTSPAQGQSMVVTFNIALARSVADHEGGPGQPGILPAGLLFPNPFTCTVTGT
jgi:hypothetical protein